MTITENCPKCGKQLIQIEKNYFKCDVCGNSFNMHKKVLNHFEYLDIINGRKHWNDLKTLEEYLA